MSIALVSIMVAVAYILLIMLVLTCSVRFHTDKKS